MANVGDSDDNISSLLASFLSSSIFLLLEPLALMDRFHIQMFILTIYKAEGELSSPLGKLSYSYSIIVASSI